MKKVFTLSALTLLFLILDNGLVPFFAIKTYYPSLLFVFIISYAIIYGSFEGLWLGLIAGILQDIYFFNGFGINGFTNMLMCVLAGFIGNNIFKEKSLIPVVTNFILSLLKGVMVIIICYLIGKYVNIKMVIYQGLYNMIISIFIYKMVYRLSQKNYMQKEWKF